MDIHFHLFPIKYYMVLGMYYSLQPIKAFLHHKNLSPKHLNDYLKTQICYIFGIFELFFSIGQDMCNCILLFNWARTLPKQREVELHWIPRLIGFKHLLHKKTILGQMYPDLEDKKEIVYKLHLHREILCIFLTNRLLNALRDQFWKDRN